MTVIMQEPAATGGELDTIGKRCELIGISAQKRKL